VEQVVLNLLNNAIDAIDSPGTITLTTRQSAGQVLLEVADTGCGMTREQIERVFMPFFTTKADGKGTGLGLSVSYRIIQDLGGHLAVQSTPGEGSIFTVALPIER
jgi:two-component system NtrC family sensor kinase